MKPDITTREDIKQIISQFYEKLLADEQMYPFFDEIVVSNHLEKHLEIITDFWEDLLLDTRSYSNNVLQKHIDVHQKLPFKKEHFDLWLGYLLATINDSFEGLKADQMIARARSIATVMQVKFNLYQ
ncbi:hypothetical protein GCM10011416_20420 [Polaribacter pacificus]|uniref:Hemoglobin n=1 Tax=Polaribacter pacificus TaxID=1775173 RepID=A0A917I1I0_9FLAO|nr:group III truncated hemoglobin [Polaribacter pacificus]GGH01569.1 hypothetical protein GCM10011416_20420 [Polaribacter pacificus]